MIENVIAQLRDLFEREHFVVDFVSCRPITSGWFFDNRFVDGDGRAGR